MSEKIKYEGGKDYKVKESDITLQEIKNNWSKTDDIVYKTPEIKFKSLEQSKKRVIAQN